MEKKACGCFVGFCRAAILLDGLGEAIMAGESAEKLASFRAAYEKQAERCVGGWRAVPPKEDR